MKPVRTPQLDATNNWTVDYLNGRWTNLLDADGSELNKGFRIRAQIMMGNTSPQLLSFRPSNLWAQINFDICKCHLHYITSQFGSALYYANRAYIKSKNTLFHADAGFYRALVLTELGEKYQALALYKQLRKMNQMTDYRRNLILTNEAWLLWDLGLLEPLQEISAQIPWPYGERLRLMLEMLTIYPVGKRFDPPVLQYLSFPMSEKESLFLVLLEGYLLLGNISDVESFRQSLFYQDVVHNSNLDLIRGLNSLLNSELHQFSFKGRDQIDYLFIESLYLAHTNKKKAQDIYFNKLIPLMKKEKYYSVFIPTEAQCSSPRYPWEKEVSNLLLGGDSKRKTIKLRLSSKSISYNKNEIRFLKSPTTWKLILSFENSSKMTKEHIHFILTGNKYRADLHDTRIFKLIQRINNKTRKAFGFDICHFTGSNELEVCCDLMRIS